MTPEIFDQTYVNTKRNLLFVSTLAISHSFGIIYIPAAPVLRDIIDKPHYFEWGLLILLLFLMTSTYFRYRATSSKNNLTVSHDQIKTLQEQEQAIYLENISKLIYSEFPDYNFEIVEKNFYSYTNQLISNPKTNNIESFIDKFLTTMMTGTARPKLASTLTVRFNNDERSTNYYKFNNLYINFTAGIDQINNKYGLYEIDNKRLTQFDKWLLILLSLSALGSILWKTSCP